MSTSTPPEPTRPSAPPTTGLMFPPLLRFFLATRVTRVQWAVAFIYGVWVLHLSFYSLQFKGDLGYRMEWFWRFLPIAWPLWLVDDDMDLRGAIRLFAVPRQGLRAMIAGYVSARLLVAMGVALFSVLVTFNVSIFDVPRVDLVHATLLAVCSCVVVVAVSTFLAMHSRGAMLVVSLYVVLVILIRIEVALPATIGNVATTVLLPLWPFSMVQGAPVLESVSWQIVQVPVSVSFWMCAAAVSMRRRYR